MTGRRILSLCLFLACFLVGSSARAEDSPPSRVGRIAAVDGNVAVRQVGGEWTDSWLNEPVAAGVSVRTSPQGRAILRSGAETIALAGATTMLEMFPDVFRMICQWLSLCVLRDLRG